MPIYEFLCDKCQTEFEELARQDSTAPQCPHCGSTSTRRLMSACARRPGSQGDGYAASGGGGCGGCSGGNCASCGR